MHHASTGVAALQEKRHFIGVEFNADIFKIAKLRLRQRFPFGNCDIYALPSKKITVSSPVFDQNAAPDSDASDTSSEPDQYESDNDKTSKADSKRKRQDTAEARRKSGKKNKERPSKIQCINTNCPSRFRVETLGGGSVGKYRYKCRECGTTFQSVPPKKS